MLFRSSPMTERRRCRLGAWGAVLSSIVILLTGCGSARYSALERSASFVPYRSLRVEQLSLQDYLGNGCGILLEGLHFSDADSSVSGPESEGDTVVSDGAWSIGTAAAVDQRGYFVTAAHCVDGGDPSIVFPSSEGPKVRKARVVWMGDLKEGGMDFALLHVPTHLDQVFHWASESDGEQIVISAGATLEMNRDANNNLDVEIRIEPVAGQLFKTLNMSEPGVVYQVILHDSPVVKGYSGGPLVDQSGRLLGINSNGRSRIPLRWNDRSRFANAIRPNLDWLTALINHDQRSKVDLDE